MCHVSLFWAGGREDTKDERRSMKWGVLGRYGRKGDIVVFSVDLDGLIEALAKRQAKMEGGDSFV